MSALTCRLGRSVGLALFWLALPLLALPQPEGAAEKIPPLRPPKAELPPGWWEQHGFWVVAAGLVCLTFVAAVALIWLRFRGPPAPAPLKRAHEEIEPLLQRPEDGIVLTRVSQAVKSYYQSAFRLPQGELTTTEFWHIVETDAQIGQELGTALGDFLRRCDQRKFAPVTPSEPLNAARTALSLVDTGEQRRLDLARQAERAQHG